MTARPCRSTGPTFRFVGFNLYDAAASDVYSCSPTNRLDAAGRARRARLFAAKPTADFDAGASGYLVWQLNRTNTDTYGVIIGSQDLLYVVLRHAAKRWASGP